MQKYQLIQVKTPFYFNVNPCCRQYKHLSSRTAEYLLYHPCTMQALHLSQAPEMNTNSGPEPQKHSGHLTQKGAKNSSASKALRKATCWNSFTLYFNHITGSFHWFHCEYFTQHKVHNKCSLGSKLLIFFCCKT